MKRNNGHDKGERTENNSTKPMDSKRDIEKSGDEKTDQDFPGYPHYPAKEDIMDKRTDSHRVDVDVENLARGQNASGINERYTAEQERGKTGADQQSFDEEQDQSGTNSAGSDSLDTMNSKSDEIGTRQNVSNDDLKKSSGQNGNQ